MGKLFRAFKAEQRKLLSKSSVIVSIILLFALTLGAAFGVLYLSSETDEEGRLADAFGNIHAENLFSAQPEGAWRAFAEQTVEQKGLEIEYLAVELAGASGARKALLERELREATADKAIAEYRLENELTVYDWRGQYALILCLWLLTPLAAVIAVLYASDIFAGEFSRGTIRVIVSRPATRLKLYIAKLMCAGLLATVLLGAVYLAAAIGCGALFGSPQGVYAGYRNGAVYVAEWSSHLFSVFLCCLAAVLVPTALCAAVGNVTRSRAVSAVVGCLLAVCGMYSGRLTGLFDSSLAGLLLPGCFDLTIPLCGTAYNSGCDLTACAVSVALHLGVFLFAGYAGFRKDI